MKDISSTAKLSHSRNHVYPKKRPSHGVSKHKTPALAAKRSPRSARAALQQATQRTRDAQIAQLRTQGIVLEEEYRDEIRVYMHEMEIATSSSASCMDQQPEIKWHMRPCLVDFLVEVHFSFRLRPETLYLTLNIIDRYVSRRIVFVKHYQLVGCAALWIAAKFEDAKERVPTVQDLVQVCRDTYDESAFIQMEGHVLSTIQWTLGHPTAEAWLRAITCGPCMEEAKVGHIARFLMEITLFYREFIKYPPSTIALAALTLARSLCGKPSRLWEETEESLEVIELLDVRLAKHVDELSETVVRKYSYAFYSKAATFVVQHYLQGGRFIRQPPTQQLPVTPSRSPSSVSTTAMSTPMGSISSMSDMSDDMPATPTTPPTSSSSSWDAYIVNSNAGVLASSMCNDACTQPLPPSSDDKENLRSTFEPSYGKSGAEIHPSLLPHEYVQLGRPALNSLSNISSPRTAMVS